MPSLALPDACPPIDDLVAFSVGELSDEELRRVAEHLDNCPTCAAAVHRSAEQFDPWIAAIREASSAEAAPDERLEEEIAAAEERLLFELSRRDEISFKEPTRESSSIPGGKFREYELGERLGQGGMGVVYRARHSRLGKVVAIKVLVGKHQDRSCRERFEREMRAVGMLNHPNVVQATDAGIEGGAPFLVMELVEGLDLAQLVAGRGCLPIADACELARQAALGLAHAHENGLIHRDVKPSNLMLTPAGVVKILDLGLARLTGPPTEGSLSTASDHFLGTYDYAAPEQSDDPRSADARSDLYSLGCTLYCLLTGRPPFATAPFRTPVQKIKAHAAVPPPPLREARPAVPAGLVAVVERLLAKAPSQRYASATEAAEALAPFIAGSDLPALLDPPGGSLGIAPPPRSAGEHERPSRLTRRVVLATQLLLSLIIGGLLGWKLLRTPDRVPLEKTIDSLAVLPFVSEDEELGSGITLALTNRLSMATHLQVRPHASVVGYAMADPIQVGQEQAVQSVVTGSIQALGDDVLISVQLIDVERERLLWGETYRRSSHELLEVTTELAAVIVKELHLQLTGGEHADVARRETANRKAFRSYVLGQVEWNKRSRQGLESAREHFLQATALDEDYAAAHVGLADCYINLAEVGLMPPGEAYPRAQASAWKALTLEPGLADAHATLAMAYFEYDWKFDEAEDRFRQALLRNGNRPKTRQWYAEFLSAMGRHDEALEQILVARRLDPLSPIVATVQGVVLYKARQYDDAIAHYHRVLDQHRDFTRLRGYLADAYEQKGQHEQALGQWAFLLEGDQPTIDRLRGALQADGATGYYKSRLEAKDRLDRRYPLSRVFTAGLYAQAGELEKALDVLEQAQVDRDGALAPNLKVNPIFDPLRKHERFVVLLQNMAYPD